MSDKWLLLIFILVIYSIYFAYKLLIHKAWKKDNQRTYDKKAVEQLCIFIGLLLIIFIMYLLIRSN